MKQPMSICLEDVKASNDTVRYLCCSVRVGRRPGLSLDNKGVTRWRINDDIAFQLFVTMDDCLALYRLSGGAPVQVRRAGRTLDVPVEKPVILRQGDELQIGGRLYRIHTHGRIDRLHAPYFFVPTLQRAARTAAALAIGTALTTTACKTEDGVDKEDGVNEVDIGTDSDTIDVREFPPDVEQNPWHPDTDTDADTDDTDADTDDTDDTDADTDDTDTDADTDDTDTDDTDTRGSE